MRNFSSVYRAITPFLFLAFLSYGAGVAPAESEKTESEAPCTAEEMAFLPKYMKVKTSHSGKRLLLKISQAKASQTASCSMSKTSEGWQEFRFRFSTQSPVQIKVHTSSLGSLLWKLERKFHATELTLVSKQPGKPIYQLTLADPTTQAVYEFQINHATKSIRVRTKS